MEPATPAVAPPPLLQNSPLNPAAPVQSQIAPDVDDKDAADCAWLEPGEHLVMVVHRYPIGIVLFYLEAFVTVIAIGALTMFLAPNFMESLSGQSYRLFFGGVLLAVTLIALMLFVATYVYRQSRLIVSDKSVVQILQRGLFMRKICRLSMSNVQDVSAEHNGILANLLGFGTLTIETAGEEDNFVFPYCPNPDMYAQRILDDRQQYVQALDAGEQASDSA